MIFASGVTASSLNRFTASESICLLCSGAQKSEHSGWKATPPSRSRTLPAVGPQSQVHPKEFQPMLSFVLTHSLRPSEPL